MFQSSKYFYKKYVFVTFLNPLMWRASVLKSPSVGAASFISVAVGHSRSTMPQERD